MQNSRTSTEIYIQIKFENSLMLSIGTYWALREMRNTISVESNLQIYIVL